MKYISILFGLFSIFADSFSQGNALIRLINDSTLTHASVSVSITDPSNNKRITGYDQERSLTPASVLKLVTSAASLELLGPDYIFSTTIGYTGTFNSVTGTLSGDLIIKGGGDPCLGSENFSTYYGDLISDWSTEIIRFGIKTITGRVITDDSFYDYEPVPSKWIWEDIGNYYGAGVFGLSIFDNYYTVKLKTSKPGTKTEIIEIIPALVEPVIRNFLVAEGTDDNGYIFGSPYNNSVWISGTIPPNRNSFALKGSIPDPPLLAAKMLNAKLISSGVAVKGEPTTIRVSDYQAKYDYKIITETLSPPLSEIIAILNRESINLYAESLLKHLGLLYKKDGSTESGIEVVLDFLTDAGLKTDGITIADGSGLSPSNKINTGVLEELLVYMKNKSRYFEYFSKSLPEAGKEGTLKNYFTDPLFTGRLRLKTGSMSGVRSFAGYVTAASGREIVVAIIINNYSGTSARVISAVEEIIKEVILEN